MSPERLERMLIAAIETLDRAKAEAEQNPEDPFAARELDSAVEFALDVRAVASEWGYPE